MKKDTSWIYHSFSSSYYYYPVAEVDVFVIQRNEDISDETWQAGQRPTFDVDRIYRDDLCDCKITHTQYEMLTICKCSLKKGTPFSAKCLL